MNQNLKDMIWLDSIETNKNLQSSEMSPDKFQYTFYGEPREEKLEVLHLSLNDINLIT